MMSSPVGLGLIKRFSPLNYNATRDYHGWTIAYLNRDLDIPNLRITPEMRVSLTQAEEMLHARLERAAMTINSCVYVDLRQKQFDALCSFVYFLHDMRLFSEGRIPGLLNERRFDEAGVALLQDLRVNQAHLEAMERRRYLELKLFSQENG